MSVGVEKRVVMAKRVAARWITRKAQAEHRFSVLLGGRDIRNLPNLLRSYRDGKVALSEVTPCADLGIIDNGDSLTLWSNNREAMLNLKDWFEVRGFETTGVW